MEGKYLFETFEASAGEFDGKFSEYVNSKYSGGWKYKSCQFDHEGDRRTASCVFKRS